MKTTIDLPANLLKQAKRKALEHNTTLKALIASGLRRELNSPHTGSSDPIDQLRSAGAKLWAGVKADTYVRQLRKGWK